MKLLLIIAVLALLLLIAVWAGQRRLIYFPDRSVPAPEDVGLANIEQARFTADDGVHLCGWFAPAAGPSRELAVLVCHGNAGNVADRAYLLRHLPQLGLSVLAFDSRGYGGSDDVQPAEEGLYRDGRAALAWLEQRTGLPRDRIVLFGESLGAAVAVELAARSADAESAAGASHAGDAMPAAGAPHAGDAMPAAGAPHAGDVTRTAGAPHALILQSPFTSLAAVAAVHYPWLPVRLLLRDRYDSASRIGRVRAPLLVLHGVRDAIVPVEQGRSLAALAGGDHRMVEVPNAGHNDMWRDAAARRADIAAFLDGISAKAAPPPAPGAGPR